MNGSKGQRVSHGGTGSAATTATTPVYSCFDSTHALILGYPSTTMQELKKKIEEGGGSASVKLPSRQPQIIICGSTFDKTFREVKKLPLLVSVPVVTQDWVAQCVSVNKQVAYNSYVLKPLAGTHICITNFGSHDRDQIQKQVEAAGAAYTAELHKDRCTHLVCKIATGPKYKAACGWRTCHVVTLAWVKESLKLGYLAPEEQYRPPPAPEGATATAAAVQCGPAVPPAALQGQGFYSAATRVSTSEATSNSGQQQQEQQEAVTADTTAQQQHTYAAAAAAAAATAAQAGSTGRATRTSVRTRTAPAAASGSNHNIGATPQQQQQQAAQAAAAAADAADDAPMLLERVVMWWCGLPPADSPEYLELQHILHLYAGVRFPDLCDATTHIMVGTKASKAELQAVGQFLQSARRRLEVVTPQWLQLCHQEQRLVIDGRHKLSTRDVLQYAGLGPAAAAAAGLTTAGSGSTAGGVFSSIFGGGDSNAGFPGGAGCGITGGVFAKSASRHGFPSVAQEQQQQQQQQEAAAAAAAAVPAYWALEHQPRDPDKVFEDSWFTVAALQSDPTEHQQALDFIRRFGGKVFKADSVKPPPRHPKVFAVCPPSLSAEAEQELMRDASFRVVDPSCRVTIQWMEFCVQRKELVRITQRTILFAPLRHKLPLQGFEGVRVFVTGYDSVKRRTIAALVQLLGGRMCETAKKGATTHLMLPRWGPDDAADNRCDITESSIKKVHWASRNGVQMVASEWLLECAHAGKKLGEDFFRPEGKLELLPAPTATQAMTSQLGPTQMPGSTQVPAISRPSAVAAPASIKCPLPSQPHRLANTTAAGGGAGEVCAGTDGGASSSSAPIRKSNWLAANLANRMAPPAQQQQQQQQRARRRLPGSCTVTAAEPDGFASDLQLQRQGKDRGQQWQQPQPQDQRQEQDQLQQQQQHQQQHSSTTAHVTPAVQPNVAAAETGAEAAAAAAAIQPAAAAAPATAASAAEAAALKLAASPLADSEGDDVLANVEGLLKTVNTLASRDPVDASQQMLAADMLQHMELTGRVASGAGAAATCSAGSGGSGHTLRNKRRAAAAGSGDRGSVEPEGCVDGAGSGGSVSGPAAAAKRHRRSTTTAAGSNSGGAAGAMPPPARVAPGSRGAAAGSGAAAGGSGGPGASGGCVRGSRYSTRRAAAGTPTDVVEMSQQVGYDVGDHPELLLAAFGRRRGGSVADEAGVKDEMLARLTRLKSTG